MKDFLQKILEIPAVWVYVVVGLLVFAEDAIFVGFVLPGETAAVLGGVAASQGHARLSILLPVVVGAAIIGDSVGYEIGKKFGPRVLRTEFMVKRGERIDRARDFLARRGGSAVFLGRFVAFFRAVMPGLAGMSNMQYRKFLFFNAFGGVTWGCTFVLLGYIAGNSYERVAKVVGRGIALAVVGIVIVALVAWRVREHLRRRHAHPERSAENDTVPSADD